MQASVNSITSRHPETVLVTGGNGRLGTALSSIIQCVSVDKTDLDITDREAVHSYLERLKPDVLVHCAAYTDVTKAEQEKETCYNINVIGTENLLRYFSGKKFVYISTDYVFDGERGNYSEDDVPNPVNFYSLTKLLGEVATRQYPRTLIIRTSFKADGPWPYPEAFVDQWTSADFVSDRAPQIARAALMPDLFGIIHIGGERKTVFLLAQKTTPDVREKSINDVPVRLPRDVSLDSSRWNALSH